LLGASMPLPTQVLVYKSRGAVHTVHKLSLIWPLPSIHQVAWNFSPFTEIGLLTVTVKFDWTKLLTKAFLYFSFVCSEKDILWLCDYITWYAIMKINEVCHVPPLQKMMYPIQKCTCTAPTKPFAIGQHLIKRNDWSTKKLVTNPKNTINTS